MRNSFLAFFIALSAACSGGDPGSHSDPYGSDLLGARIRGDGEIKGGGDASNAGRSPSAAAGPASGGSGAASGTSGGGTGTLAAGILTAGVWDDNRNFDVFVNQRFQGPGALPIAASAHQAAKLMFGAGSAKTKLDISLLIDTTGSMGDEIAYLQKEFDALASTISAKYPGAAQRWSLVLYRDTTDDYIVRWFDFRDDTSEFRTKLAAQSAGGGGDLPEAPDQGLSVASRLSWREDDATAKLLFWVADAPHHDERAQHMADAIVEARSAGIHVYPVASSGVDDLAESSMRAAAQLTGGRYLFLTDDSGVGGAHKEPRLPCYFVTRLDHAILRMVDVELAGDYREPAASEIIRTGGSPADGHCTLEDGAVVEVF